MDAGADIKSMNEYYDEYYSSIDAGAVKVTDGIGFTSIDGGSMEGEASMVSEQSDSPDTADQTPEGEADVSDTAEQTADVSEEQTANAPGTEAPDQTADAPDEVGQTAEASDTADQVPDGAADVPDTAGQIPDEAADVPEAAAQPSADVPAE